MQRSLNRNAERLSPNIAGNPGIVRLFVLYLCAIAAIATLVDRNLPPLPLCEQAIAATKAKSLQKQAQNPLQPTNQVGYSIYIQTTKSRAAMNYASFAPYKINEAHEALVEAAEAMGRRWALNGNTTLPRWTQVGDQKIPVVGSIGDAGQAFVRGWKEVGKGKKSA